ncbi:hypothetical protein [Comamonas serinivorans]|uniref:hypothetical protein n=1 Tax=Comamonas serinivorans TaxID=1082851 RepID=UPI0012F8E6FC|nr:hypothetical protein [Comamonas serinivorans]
MRNTALPILALAVALTACGGGGDDDDVGTPSPTPSPAPTPVPAPTPSASASPLSGAWQGTATDGSSLNAVVLDDGKLWLVGLRGGQPSIQVHGATQASSGRLSSSVRYVDYGAPLFISGSLQGSYVPGSSISATLTAGGVVTGPHTLTPMPKAVFDYDRAASLSDVTGSWVAQGTQITVRADGAFETLSNGCRNTGTVKPDARKNVFALNLTMGAAPCAYPGQRLTGVVVTFSSAGKPTLLATALNDQLSLTLPAVRP